jgi:hypothetical protein
VRYAKARLAGFSEVGARGAEPKYGGETDRGILALLDSPSPNGYASWSGSLIAKALGDVHVPNGRAITGQSHDYKRNGTTTLFAALDLKSGEVVGLSMSEIKSAKTSVQCIDLAGIHASLPPWSYTRSYKLAKA